MLQSALQKGMLALVGVRVSLQPLFWRGYNLLGQMHLSVVDVSCCLVRVYSLGAKRFLQAATLALAPFASCCVLAIWLL